MKSIAQIDEASSGLVLHSNLRNGRKNRCRRDRGQKPAKRKYSDDDQLSVFREAFILSCVDLGMVAHCSMELMMRDMAFHVAERGGSSGFGAFSMSPRVSTGPAECILLSSLPGVFGTMLTFDPASGIAR